MRFINANISVIMLTCEFCQHARIVLLDNDVRHIHLYTYDNHWAPCNQKGFKIHLQNSKITLTTFSEPQGHIITKLYIKHSSVDIFQFSNRRPQPFSSEDNGEIVPNRANQLLWLETMSTTTVIDIYSNQKYFWLNTFGNVFTIKRFFKNLNALHVYTIPCESKTNF